MALFQWPNHGGGILNRCEAYYEKKINPKVVAKLKTKWQFVTGDIKWRTLMIPDNHGKQNLYSGAAIWGSSAPIDIGRNLVLLATGNLYTTPPDINIM